MSTIWSDLALQLQDAMTQDEFAPTLLADGRDLDDRLLRASHSRLALTSDEGQALYREVTAYVIKLNNVHEELKRQYGC